MTMGSSATVIPRHRGDGAGEMGDNLPSVDLGSGRSAKFIAAGGDHTCAILDDGSVKCWGRNDYGQLGYGDTQNRGDGAGEMGDTLPTRLTWGLVGRRSSSPPVATTRVRSWTTAA